MEGINEGESVGSGLSAGRRNSSEKVLVVEGLTKHYGGLAAVQGVTFDVHHSEIFGILGPNGAGKTTTLEMIETLRTIDSGTVTVNGVDVHLQPEEAKRQLGVQLQSSAFFDKLTLAELIVLFAEFYNRLVDPATLLAEADLLEKKDSFVNQLSGGQKQRFSIAIALVNDPQLLFLDEPTTGLDPQARRNLWNVIRRIRSEGKTIVLTTHYMDEAEELCDRVAIMDGGKIIALAAPHELIRGLVSRGFRKERIERLANLEDVFLDLTGHSLRGD